MKVVEITEESLKIINSLCDLALKGQGVSAFGLVKEVEKWMLKAFDKEEEKDVSEPISSIS